jgi:hypothetical protein
MNTPSCLTGAKCWAVRFPVGRGRRPAPTKPNNNEIGLRKILVGAGQGALAPTSCESERLRGKSPAGAGLLVHRLFRGYDLVDRGAFGLCVIPLLIGLVQELVDDARALLLLDPSLLRFPLRGEDLVIYFVAH